MTVLLLIALQLQIGAIGGTVSDPSHGAIRRARVVLREHDSALERTATTDEAGAFLFHNLSYGLYQLKVEASGFRAHSEAIRVRSNLTVEVAVVLALAGTEEAITVRAEEELDEVMERRGAELVDFDRMRVKPRTLLDVSAGIRLFAERRVSVDLQLDVRNLAGAAFAYNFSNPFSGTHFGHPRLISGRLKLSFQ